MRQTGLRQLRNARNVHSCVHALVSQACETKFDGGNAVAFGAGSAARPRPANCDLVQWREEVCVRKGVGTESSRELADED